MVLTRNLREHRRGLGQSVRKRRLDANLSTLDLAKRAKLGRSMIDRIESGDPKVSIGAYMVAVHHLDGLDGFLGQGVFEFFDHVPNTEYAPSAVWDRMD